MSNPFSAKKPEPDTGKSVENEVANEKDAEREEVPVSEPVADKSAPQEMRSGDSPPALGMDEVSCRTCRYLDFQGESRTNASGGECRRNAPVPGANQLASWPRVTWEGWCGEWVTGVSDEDMVKMARAIADEQADGPIGGFVKRPSAKPKA